MRLRAMPELQRLYEGRDGKVVLRQGKKSLRSSNEGLHLHELYGSQEKQS